MRKLAGLLVVLVMTACDASSSTTDAGRGDAGPPQRCMGCAATCGADGVARCDNGPSCEGCVVSCQDPRFGALAAECTIEVPTCAAGGASASSMCWREEWFAPSP